MKSAQQIHRAARLAGIEPFRVMDVQNRAHELESQGREIIHMEIGQPDFSAPPQVIEAATRAIRERPLGYTQSLGLPELREAISHYYQTRYAVDVPSERIVITAGASGAFLLALGALVDPSDEVLMPDPCYPCNRHFVRLFEGRARMIASDEYRAYQLSASDVRREWNGRVRGVMLASPSNPTGTTIPTEELRGILEIAASRGGFALVDEIYHALSYGDRLATALQFSEDVFVVNSFSKYFCMTGWRLGWLVVPRAYLRAIEKLAQNAYICASAPAQYAALAAFRPDTIAVLEERRAEFQRRRDFLVPALRDLGFRIPIVPTGAFYIYAGCESFSPDSSAFALRLLDEAGVAITPGLDFGANQPEKHVRIAYTQSLDALKEGVKRIDKLLGR
ncbi:MAG: aminotransferase [Betaproteobacteria bacterium RIFCSPLOWO2_12_FULL_63_13]|nr:MAG: aminotransferase [Betaproteobacteria bacterium RIFCSPLOWO2_02_FULL_63_19]OGA52900.1 MAG: aminotransferase [Betaproteobacteria bacterium RIFCSPLOWO2_12_FULL_63_13]